MFKVRLSITSAFWEVTAPIETRAKYHDDRLYVEHYQAYTGQFIIGAVFKKGTRRDPDSFLGLLSGPHDTGAT